VLREKKSFYLEEIENACPHSFAERSLHRKKTQPWQRERFPTQTGKHPVEGWDCPQRRRETGSSVWRMKKSMTILLNKKSSQFAQHKGAISSPVEERGEKSSTPGMKGKESIFVRGGPCGEDFAWLPIGENGPLSSWEKGGKSKNLPEKKRWALSP